MTLAQLEFILTYAQHAAITMLWFASRVVAIAGSQVMA